MSLTKDGLTRSLMDSHKLPRREADKCVNKFFEAIEECLRRGQDVSLSGIGGFRLSDKMARLGRNPQTGEPLEISARRVVTFKISTALAEDIDLKYDRKVGE